MSYQVESIENFEREAKRLKKKFPSLKEEISLFERRNRRFD